MLPRTLSGALAAALLSLPPFLSACAQGDPPEAGPPPAAPPAAVPYASPPADSSAPLSGAPGAAQARSVMLRFDPGSADLSPGARASLRPVLDQLRTNPGAVATITSYAERMEFETARARATAVRRILTGQGVTARRIRMVNAGMTARADPQVVQVQVQ